MLIRKEMVLVIMSTLIIGDDNEQYYFYAMFCVGDPCFQCSLNGKHSHAVVSGERRYGGGGASRPHMSGVGRHEVVASDFKVAAFQPLEILLSNKPSRFFAFLLKFYYTT